MKPTKTDRRALAAFMAPALVMMLVFFVIPVLYVIAVSVLKWNGISAPSFNGMKKLRPAVQGQGFHPLYRQQRHMGVHRGMHSGAAGDAHGDHTSRKPRGWKFFRTVYFFPQVISGIALAMLWRGIYNADYGLLNGC